MGFFDEGMSILAKKKVEQDVARLVRSGWAYDTWAWAHKQGSEGGVGPSERGLPEMEKSGWYAVAATDIY